MTNTLTPENATVAIKKYGNKTPQPVTTLDSGVVLGIYGPGGAGKTTCMASITSSPLASPMLVLSARGNTHVVSSMADRVHVIEITKFDEVLEILRDVKNDRDCQYKSMGFDVVTEMHAMNLHNRYGSMRAVDWQKHNAVTADIMDVIRFATDLAAGPKKMNIVLTFHKVPETRKIVGQEVIRDEIAVSKSLQVQAPGILSFLGELYIKDEAPPWNRELNFTPTEKTHQSKFQIDPQHPTASTIPMVQYKPDLGDIVEVLRNGKVWPADKHKPAGMAVVSR